MHALSLFVAAMRPRMMDDEARQLLLVRGAVPGSKNGHVVVSPAIKVKVSRVGAAAAVPAKGAK